MKYFVALLMVVSMNIEFLIAQNSSVTVTTMISDELVEHFKTNGRIFLFLNQNSREPRHSIWPNKSNLIFATNLENWNGRNFTFNNSVQLVKTGENMLENIPNGKYYLQVLWDQDKTESRINAPGNVHSEVVQIELKNDTAIVLPLTKCIESPELEETELIKFADIKSDVLSAWWGKEMRLKAAVVLPRNFHKNPDDRYPFRYNIAGYGGRFTRVYGFNRYWDWWMSEDAPELVQVFLDGEGPFGDCYQLDSENSGPYGKALTEELIPYLENLYRGMGTAESRFVDGCSTGGWVSLALQLFYPDFFGGCFSYSPDQVDFEHCQLINIYKDENAFYNEFGYLRPIVRDVTGEPRISQKDFIQYENVLGYSNSYVTSGGQFSAFTALFSPKGTDGLPKPLFDPVTGIIDHKVAEHWKKYDLKYYVETNWNTLGPKLQGKIWAWGADMDNFYLNPALRSFDEMLKKMKNPTSDAQISFTPMARHCEEYNHLKVLLQIKEKLNSKQ